MSITNFIGKNTIATVFILSALKSIFFGFNGFVDKIRSKNLPFPVILAVLALTIKMLGGFSIILGRYTNYGVAFY